MRASRLGIAVVALLVLAGCGDPEDAEVVVGATATPNDGVRTPTPSRSPTPIGAVPTATATTTPTPMTTVTFGGATPEDTATATATPVTTATVGATPLPTATPSGPIDAGVQRTAGDLLPFLANIDLLTGGSVSALGVVPALKTDQCPAGGTRVDDEKFPGRTLTFQACAVADQLGSFAFDGTVVITLANFDSGTIAFDFSVTDRTANRVVAFLGTLALSVESSGFVLNGPLTVTNPEGTLTLTADDVAITAQRKLVSGRGSITDDGDNFELQTVSFVVTRRGAASNLTATFDDSSVHTYTLDLVTGDLAQTS